MNLRKGTIKIRAANLCYMLSILWASYDVIEFQTTDAYSNIDLTNVEYNMYTHSREEK
jgi:hypothetical protein